MGVCLTCDNPAENKYCSRKCFYEGRKVKIGPRYCEHCGKLISKGNLVPAQYKVRKFCSNKCSAASRRVGVVLKACLECGKVIPQRPGRSPWDYNQQKYCSKGCGAKANHQVVEVKGKLCLECGNIIPRGNLSPSAYKGRKFCSRRCASKHMWAIGVFPKPNPPTCIDCDKRVSYGGIQRCKSCASINNWAEGKYTEERNHKIGLSTKQRWEEGVYDDPEVKARQSAGVSAAWERGAYDEEWHEGQSDRIKEAWARGDFDDRSSGKKSPSGPESLMMEVLNSRDVDYVFQFPIKQKRFDFFLPDHNLIIEYDGLYWHSKPEQIANDLYKDGLAAEEGFDIFRIKSLSNRDLRGSEMETILAEQFPDIFEMAGSGGGVMI